MSLEDRAAMQCWGVDTGNMSRPSHWVKVLRLMSVCKVALLLQGCRRGTLLGLFLGSSRSVKSKQGNSSG
jgi:hypothetical protein